MFPHGDLYQSGIAVSGHVGKRFFYNADKTIFDFPRNFKSHVIVQGYRTERKIRGYQDGAGEQMSHIVMNFSGNPVSFFQRGCINFVILFFRKHPVFFFQKEIFFGTVVS